MYFIWLTLSCRLRDNIVVNNILHMQEWLERTPGLEMDGFNFWKKLEINIFNGLSQEKERIEVGDEQQALASSPEIRRLTDFAFRSFFFSGTENARFRCEGGTDGRTSETERRVHNSL